MEENATEYKEAQDARNRVAAGLSKARKAVLTGQNEIDDTLPPHLMGG